MIRRGHAGNFRGEVVYCYFTSAGGAVSDVLRRVNRTLVPAELLEEVLGMHAAIPSAGQSPFEARMIRLFELLESKGHQQNIRDLAAAIDIRLTVLTRLQSGGLLHGWTLPDVQSGANYSRADLLVAAAKERVIEDMAGQAAFDVDRFRRRVLASANARQRG
jgi:hypothetical protein